MKKYTKKDLQNIVLLQLENLNAVHDLLTIIKVQNELMHNSNKKLKEEISEFKKTLYSTPVKKTSSGS